MSAAFREQTERDEQINILSSCTVEELISICQAKSIDEIDGLNKDELIHLLLQEL